MTHKNILLAIAVGFLLAIFTATPAQAFPDSRQHWARMTIDHLESRELIKGYPDGTYHPDSYISREEFTTLLVKAIHKEQEAEQLLKVDSSFEDTQTAWSRGYIELARELNLARGNGQGLFLPRAYITREEAVTMLCQCLGTSSVNLYPFDFEDDSNISGWASEAVGLACQKGLIKGYPDGSFRPQAAVSRAEVAILLSGLLRVRGEEYQLYGNLKSINLPLKQINIEVNGKTENFELASNVYIYNEENGNSVGEVKLPASAYFDLDQNGKVVFISLTPAYDMGKVNLQLSALPTYNKTVSSENNLQGLNATQEISSLATAAKSDPASSLKVTREAMQVNDFVKQTGATGKGQLVAVIDSGLDVGHPDLQKTSENYNKIIDFIDLTDEGKLILDHTAKASDGYIEIGINKINVKNLKSVDGLYQWAYFDTWRLPAVIRDSLPARQILMLAARSHYINRYDSVYIDMDMDNDLSDEIEMKKYNELNQFLSLKGPGDRKFNWVVTDIDREGKYLKLGFDIYGHGTQVAGVVAANGNIQGVAPGVQLLPIKIINSAGLANLNNLQNAIQVAASRGASIAVVSMGQLQLTAAEKNSLGVVASNAWTNYGMAICMAAGNDGPGLRTVADTAAIKNIISVGAYATPEMWYNDFGWKVKGNTLWYFSATGPGADGMAAPLVLAPGSALSTCPLWNDSPYNLEQGTSMAAPHAAGAAALLMDAATHTLFRDDAQSLWMALLGGAQPLKGYQAVEQGYGAINLLRSWQEMQSLKASALSYQSIQSSPGYPNGSGLYCPGLSPGQLSLTIKNTSQQNSYLAVGSLANWIKPEQISLQIPAAGQRSFDLSYSGLDQPGLYSEFLVADDADTAGWDLTVLQTVVIPYQLNKLKDKTLLVEEQLDAGLMRRFFFEVPAGTSRLNFNLLTGNNGRVCMYINQPDGTRDISGYAGRGELQETPAVNASYNNPEPGLWEVIIYSSVTLSTLKLDTSAYTFTASQEGAASSPLRADSKYLVSVIPDKIKSGEKNWVSIYFRNPVSKKPATGMVTIQGKLYEIKNGLVQIELVPASDILDLQLAW